MLKILYLLFIAVYIFCVPGYLIASTSFKRNAGFWKISLGLGLGITLIPILSFSAAMLLRTVITEALLLTVATIINTACLALIFLKTCGNNCRRRNK